MTTEHIAEQYVPQVGDKFTIRWKQHFDRSYIDAVWDAVHVEGDTVIGFSEYGDYGQKRKIVFRTFDVAFQRVRFDADKARLIASAPDLLNALEVIIERFGPVEDSFIFSKRMAIQKCRYAIAKATQE